LFEKELGHPLEQVDTDDWIVRDEGYRLKLQKKLDGSFIKPPNQQYIPKVTMSYAQLISPRPFSSPNKGSNNKFIY